MRTCITRILAATVVMGLGLACQPKPGDYRVYKITQLTPQQDDGCPGGLLPEPGDDSTFFSVSTLAVFASDVDSFFLEFLGTAVTGTRDGADYTFSGDLVDVNEVTDNTNTRLTRTLDVTLTIKGKQISGSYVEVEKLVCEGDSNVCMAIDGYTCTRTNNFFGSEINDIELEYGVDGAPAP